MINIKFLSNAGIVLEFNQLRIIIDGLYSDTGHSFSKMPLNAINNLYRSKLKNQQSIILFTHNHCDHFSLIKTVEYMSVDRSAKIYIPSSNLSTEELIVLKKYSCEFINPKKEEIVNILNKEKTYIKAIKTPHDGDKFKNIVNISYILEIQGIKILVTGDGDYKSSDYNILRNEKISYAIINPLFFHNLEGRKLLRNLSIKKIILNHIPFQEDDIYSIRKLVEKDILKYKSEFEILPLIFKNQVIHLN